MVLRTSSAVKVARALGYPGTRFQSVRYLEIEVKRFRSLYHPDQPQESAENFSITMLKNVEQRFRDVVLKMFNPNSPLFSFQQFLRENFDPLMPENI